MNVFDIIGPVMIGPSSSHTAGAARIGGVARALLGAQPVRADIGLHGSFACTGRGHGTDKAIVAGLLGFAPDDTRLRDALVIAEQQGMQVTIHPVEIDGAHPQHRPPASGSRRRRHAGHAGQQRGRRQHPHHRH